MATITIIRQTETKPFSIYSKLIEYIFSAKIVELSILYIKSLQRTEMLLVLLLACAELLKSAAKITTLSPSPLLGYVKLPL